MAPNRVFFSRINKKAMGSAIRALINKNKRRRPIFFKTVSAAALQTVFAGRHEPAFSFYESDLRGIAIEAVRSVSHLVLARFWLMPGLPLFRTERSGPDRSRHAPSGSVFLGKPLVTLTRRFWQARACTRSAPISPQARPENFQCRAVFIQSPRALVPGKPRGCLSPTRF